MVCLAQLCKIASVICTIDLSSRLAKRCLRAKSQPKHREVSYSAQRRHTDGRMRERRYVTKSVCGRLAGACAAQKGHRLELGWVHSWGSAMAHRKGLCVGVGVWVCVCVCGCEWVCVGVCSTVHCHTRARDRKIKDGASLLALGEVSREAVARCTPRDSVRLEGRVRAHAASSSEGRWLCQGERARVRESRQLRDTT